MGKNIKISLLLILLLTGLSSCINEYPDETKCPHETLVKVSVHNEWLPDYEEAFTRSENLSWRYQFKVFPKGNTTNEVKELTVFQDNIGLTAFTIDLSLLPGEYDLWVWADLCNADTGESLFYDSKDFASITYKKPYTGDTNNREAFTGMTLIEVKANKDLKNEIIADINLIRPMARYEIISTDLSDFEIHEENRGIVKKTSNQETGSELQNSLSKYSIRVVYPYFMPAVFDNFTDKAIDSWSNVSFMGEISVISTDEALLGLDYVFINDEGSVQVEVEIYDPEGKIVSKTPTFTIPLLRNRTTIVKGRFLTTYVNGGVEINPDFDGDFNIEYK